MDRVVLDTDVSSLSLKRRLPSPVMTRLIGKQPCITFITLGELIQWAELRQWGRRNRDALNHWLNGVIVLPYSDDVARTWGQISAYAIRRGRLGPEDLSLTPPPHPREGEISFVRSTDREYRQTIQRRFAELTITRRTKQSELDQIKIDASPAGDDADLLDQIP